MSKSYCANCGEKSFNGACTNCHEEIYIREQYWDLNMEVPVLIEKKCIEHEKEIAKQPPPTKKDRADG